MSPVKKKVCRETPVHQSITAETDYQHLSFEELRMLEYSNGDKYGHPQTFQEGTSPGFAARKVFATSELMEMILLQISYEAADRQKAELEAEKRHMKDLSDSKDNLFYCGQPVDPHRRDNLISRTTLEPVTTLAPLRRVCRSFSEAFNGSPAVRREMLLEGTLRTNDSRNNIWWLLVEKIGGMSYCVRGFTGDLEDPDENEYGDQKGNGSDELLFSLGCECWIMQEGFRCKCRMKRHIERYFREDVKCMLFSKHVSPEYQALKKFLQNEKWSSPRASWRKIKLWTPGATALNIKVGVTHWAAGALFCDFDEDSQDYVPENLYMRNYRCIEGTTLGTFFDWWVTIVEESTVHEAAAYDPAFDEGIYGEIPVKKVSGKMTWESEDPKSFRKLSKDWERAKERENSVLWDEYKALDMGMTLFWD